MNKFKLLIIYNFGPYTLGYSAVYAKRKSIVCYRIKFVDTITSCIVCFLPNDRVLAYGFFFFVLSNRTKLWNTIGTTSKSFDEYKIKLISFVHVTYVSCVWDAQYEKYKKLEFNKKKKTQKNLKLNLQPLVARENIICFSRAYRSVKRRSHRLSRIKKEKKKDLIY